MTQAHRREKNPEFVRQALIESAGRLAAEKGLAAVGVQQIAATAGVTKGGFFHHFPNKQALVDAVFSELMALVDAEIETRLAADPVSYGRFTRAYLEMVLDGDMQKDRWMPVWASMITDSSLKQIWLNWFSARLNQHRDTDAGVQLEAVRFAADGIWLGQLAGILPADQTALGQHLRSITRILP